MPNEVLVIAVVLGVLGLSIRAATFLTVEQGTAAVKQRLGRFGTRAPR